MRSFDRKAKTVSPDTASAKSADMSNVENELATLVAMPRDQLSIEWRRLYRRPPPNGLSRDLLIRAIAYKVQERAFGGLPQATKQKLRTLIRRLETEGSAAVKTVRPLQPGARLVRTWQGRTHSVTVCENGFDYDGRRYRSLSQVAREITGTQWSGPRFFGLRSAKSAKSSKAEQTNV
jgi:hypothetical protein